MCISGEIQGFFGFLDLLYYVLTEDSFQFTFKVSSVLKTGTIALIFSTYGTTI